MQNKKILRIKLSAPNAHFRIAQSNNPHKSYPLPPYSTVIGILANIMGDKVEIDKFLAEPFCLGILSKHESITNEYTWLRNLNVKKHKERFGTIENRKFQGLPEHPGGQAPVVYQVLNEVEVIVYIKHPNENITDLIAKNINHPERWINHLHLGRSEDWAIPMVCDYIDIDMGSTPTHYRGSKEYYQWMPDFRVNQGKNVYCDEKRFQDYEDLYNKMPGNIVLVTTVYDLCEVSWKTKDKIEEAIIRNFRHIPARLCKGQLPWLGVGRFPKVFYDPDLKVPLFLAKINPLPKGGEKYGE